MARPETCATSPIRRASVVAVGVAHELTCAPCHGSAPPCNAEEQYTGLVADVSAVPSPQGPAGTSQSASPTPGTDPILVTPSLAIRSQPGRIELLIGTLPGRTHHLESRTSLDSGEWVLKQEIPGTGNPVLVPLSEASLSENRFFRVLVP